MIKLGFYGAAGEVTGSCYVVSTDRASVMVDMGMHQGEKVADEHNRLMPPIDMGKLDAAVLTHGHLDHCGRLPMLAKAGFRGAIHCTGPTAAITQIILRDSAHIQSEDALRYNAKLRREGEPHQQPLYDDDDVQRMLPQLTATAYGATREIAPGVTVRFFDAGHILGSASVQMVVKDGPRAVTIVFSGDVGVAGSPILRDPRTPMPADVVLLESTYGDRDHCALAQTRANLLAILQEAQASGSKVIIPAFALGRTQDIVYHIGEFLRTGALKPLRVCVDSPMASSVSELYAAAKDVYDDRARELLAQHMQPLNFPGLAYTRTVEESKQLNDAKGCVVIIAASGMCTGGRVMHHLAHEISNPKAHVVIVGYQGQGTLGRRLVDKQKTVRIFREEMPVRAKVHTLNGFSAHAGQSGLLAWAAPFQATAPRMFLTHGEDPQRQALRAKLKERFSFDAAMPRYGEAAEL